ncbi:MAG: transporter substrate-binding domain-containing protein [Desulfobacter sp.]|nr:MAG: transporter substrate-binding domain-containing protein [Desulfobacter sp.]
MKQVFYIILFVFLYGEAALGDTLTLVTLESPPAEFFRDGRAMGRNVDIAREGLKRMGIEAKVRILPWKRALVMVENGDADGIIDAAYSTERAEFLYYPHEEVYVEEWYLFRRKGSPLTLDRDLGNAGQFTLGICRGFQYGGLIQDAIEKKRFKTFQAVPDNAMNIKKLVGGRFDVFVGVKLTILYLAGKMGVAGQIEPVPMTETGRPYLLSASKTYLAFSKKTVTRKTVDRFSLVLRKMKDEGEVRRIESRYY